MNTVIFVGPKVLYTIVTSCRVVRNEPLNDHVTRAAAEYIVNDTRDVTVIILPGKSGKEGGEGGREGEGEKIYH